MGFLMASALALVVVIPIPGDLVRTSALWLLSPGILAGFGIGSGRIHDVSFWLLTLVINGIFYTAIAYGGSRIIRFFSLKLVRQ
jgi:hypothetical protein